MEPLARVVLERMIRYYRHLGELTEKGPVETVTSAQLGAALDVDPSQVRKDFAAIGLAGMSHVGYDVCEVCRTIRSAVGFDEPYTAVLIGAGKLGGAILGSPEFERYGLLIMGAFDDDPFLIGRQIEGYRIMPMARMPGFIAERRIRLAVLTVPWDAAQPVANQLVRSGITAIWNFTPVRLAVPAGVLVRNERISAGLAEIAYFLRSSQGEPGPSTRAEGEPAGAGAPS